MNSPVPCVLTITGGSESGRRARRHEHRYPHELCARRPSGQVHAFRRSGSWAAFVSGRERKDDPAQFDRMANHESVLLGISETSSDVRDLPTRIQHPTGGRRHRAVRYQAKNGSSPGRPHGWLGPPRLRRPHRRKRPGHPGTNLGRLGLLGGKLDRRHGARSTAVISADASQATVRVIRPGEELPVARSVLRSCPAIFGPMKQLP